MVRYITVLTAGLSFLLSVAAAAQAVDPRTRIERTDRNGVRWAYGERTDPMDDKRELLLAILRQRTTVGLICREGEGMQVLMVVPGWDFVPNIDQIVQVRIDRSEPFDVTVYGDRRDGTRGMARTDRPGRDFARGLLAANERIVLRNSYGNTIIIPVTLPRPETQRFQARCQQIAPVLPEAQTPPG